MQKIISISFLTKEFPPSIGGVGDYIVHLADKLGTVHRIDVITSENQEILDSKRHLDSFYNVYPSIRQWNIPGIFNFLREIYEHKTGIIIFQFTPFMYSKYGVCLYFLIWLFAAKIFYGSTIITTVHEPYNPWGDRLKAYFLSSLHRIQFLLLGIISDNIVMTTSKRELTARKWFFWKKNTVHYIPVGSNINVFPFEFADKREFRSEIADESTFIFSAFGLLEKGSRHEETLRYLAGFRLQNRHINFRFLIIGGIRTADLERKNIIDELIHELGLDGCVYWTGYQDELTISKFLSVTDIFIFNRTDGPSTRSGTLAAALSHSLPVLANRAKDTVPLFIDRDNLLLFGSPAEFNLNLLELIMNKELREKRSKKAGELYDNYFSWDKITEQYLSIIRSHDK